MIRNGLPSAPLQLASTCNENRSSIISETAIKVEDEEMDSQCGDEISNVEDELEVHLKQRQRLSIVLV